MRTLLLIILISAISCKSQPNYVLDKPAEVGDTLESEWIENVLKLEKGQLDAYSNIVYLSLLGCPSLPNYLLENPDTSAYYIVSGVYCKVNGCSALDSMNNYFLDEHDALPTFGLIVSSNLARKGKSFVVEQIKL